MTLLGLECVLEHSYSLLEKPGQYMLQGFIVSSGVDNVRSKKFINFEMFYTCNEIFSPKAMSS